MPNYRYTNGNVTIEIIRSFGNLEYSCVENKNYHGNMQFAISQKDTTIIDLVGIVTYPIGQHIGPLLIKFLIEHYGEGVNAIKLVAMEQSAKRFFTKIGFVADPNDPNIFQGNKETVLAGCNAHKGNWVITVPSCVIM